MSCKFEEPESMKKMFLQAVLCTVQYICMLEACWFITTIRSGKGLGENKYQTSYCLFPILIFKIGSGISWN